MAYLNINIPTIYAKVRKEYLYDMDEKYKGQDMDCVIFAMAGITGRALLFHCMLPNGACYWRLPISAFFQKSFERPSVPDMRVEELELWNSFSYYPSCTEFDFLGGQKGKYLGLDKKFYHGEYLFTIDWATPEVNEIDTEHSEIPDEHKCHHILALDNGNFAAQPNNRILWNVSNYTVSREWPDYKVQTTYWSVENKDWITEDTDKMFYEIQNPPHDSNKI
tara:strand:- start:254 stop:916 length:663 start_codon:yes stop_codon:yes gene_type:complete